MTSSLVGSEMCIRDRRRQEREKVHLVLQVAGRRIPHRGSLSSHPETTRKMNCPPGSDRFTPLIASAVESKALKVWMLGLTVVRTPLRNR
eukprot:8162347-Prorocentrum_lima.AAC.1